MGEYIEIMGYDELKDGEMTSIEVDGHRLLVARVGLEAYVADALCPHLHARLDRGVLEGSVVTCPSHGSQFDLSDGRCVRWTEFGGVIKTVAELVRHPRPLRVYETIIEDGKVFVGPQKEPPAA
ncbi:MAG: Rieske 2Fe-2S domain-containing protein [Actinomycetota bacterium]|nr:Rieske 2Fe-2S domain-containing protein [Actinomycetota bacterium]MDZ4180401.1 Rieske 2Fe-2S domain-containing protein [Coriobacteriia bacterium]